MLDATTGLETSGDEQLYLLVVGGWYLLTIPDFQNQTFHNEHEVQKVGASRSLCWFLGLSIYLCGSSLHYTPICTPRWLRKRNLQSFSATKKC